MKSDAGTTEAEEEMPTFLAYDSRQSSAHPLRHSVVNVIRKVAEWRATVSAPADEGSNRGSQSLPVNETDGSENSKGRDGNNSTAGGAHYLLTSLTVFTTHEPCIMCSMALLHSRVREVIFLRPMDATGGCGGHNGKGACVPRLKGVNHRYNIMRWVINDPREWTSLFTIMEGVDA